MGPVPLKNLVGLPQEAEGFARSSWECPKKPNASQKQESTNINIHPLRHLHVLEVSSLLERLHCTLERGSSPVSLLCLRSLCCRFYFYLIVLPRFLVLRVYNLIYPEAPHFLRFKCQLVGYKILGLKASLMVYS